jgi:hypothetical protein
VLERNAEVLFSFLKGVNYISKLKFYNFLSTVEETRFLLIVEENKLFVCPFNLTKLSQLSAVITAKKKTRF